MKKIAFVLCFCGFCFAGQDLQVLKVKDENNITKEEIVQISAQIKKNINNLMKDPKWNLGYKFGRKSDKFYQPKTKKATAEIKEIIRDLKKVSKDDKAYNEVCKKRVYPLMYEFYIKKDINAYENLESAAIGCIL